MRVATWNVECVRPGKGARSERIRSALSRVSADVVVLTEAHPDFSPAPGYVRHAVSAMAPDRQGGGRWVVIWARPDVVAAEVSLSGEPERSACIRVECLDARPLLVFGTVLPWRADRRHTSVRGAEAFVRSLDIQAQSWASVRAQHTDAELCVAGDFNQECGFDGPVGSRAGHAALQKVLTAHSLTCITAGTHDPLLSRKWRRSIDHVVLSRGLTTLGDIEVWPDRFPLPATLPDHHGICVRVRDA